MKTAVQADALATHDQVRTSAERVAADGKFLRAGDERFLIKGVTYGTFAPDAQGYQFPSPSRVSATCCARLWG